MLNSSQSPRTHRSRWVFVSALAVLSASPLSAAKVRVHVDSEVGRALRFAGAIEYGKFREADVDAATAEAIVATGAGEIMEEADTILLNAIQLDTTKAEVKALRQSVAADASAATGTGKAAGKRLHLVQFAGSIKQEWVDALRADGLQIVTYVPSNAYLVWGDAAALARMQGRAAEAARSAVQWEAAYQADWKVAPSVLADAKSGREIAALLDVQLVEDQAATRPPSPRSRKRAPTSSASRGPRPAT